MRRYLPIYATIYFFMLALGVATVGALDAATRPRPACPLPPGSFCTRVEDQGTGSFWICQERVR